MLTLIEPVRPPVNTMSYLLQGSANGRSIIPNLDEFVKSGSNDSPSLAFRAARQGHIFILEMLLDSSLEDLYEKKQFLTTQLNDHTLHRQSLFRKRYFLHLQRLVLRDFYLKYGAAGTLFLEELDSEIRYQLDQAIHKLVLYHRNTLRHTQEAIIDGNAVSLNTELRVKLHKEFQEKIISDANSVIISPFHKITDKNKQTISQPKTLEELQDLYDNQIPTKIKNITKYVKELDQEHQSLKDDLATTLESISSAKKARTARSYELLSELVAKKIFRPAAELRKISTLTSLPEVKSTLVDQETGNTLMHEALMNGEYLAALYLKEKGHSFFSKNYTGKSAIDMQDSEGNSLLLHLASKGDYEQICGLLIKGAKPNLTNNRNQSLLDSRVGNNTFLHFVIDKINATGYNSKYMHILLMLVTQSVRMTHLFATNSSNTTALEKLQKFPEKEKKQFFKLLKASRKVDHFTSEFQVDINWAIWQHFFQLLKPTPAPTPTNWKNLLSSLKQENKPDVALQRQFLEGVCSHLHTAKNSKSDSQLFSFLKEKLKTLKLDPKTLQMYNNNLEFYSLDLRKRSGVRKQSTDFYSIQNGEPARDCFLKQKSSYEAVSSQLPPSPKANDKTQAEDQTIAEQKVCFDPIFTTLKDKPPVRCIDPLHWFEHPRTKLVR